MKALQYGWLTVSLFLLPFIGRAQQFGDFTYSSDGTNITITKYTGAGGDVTIPSMIAGLPVVSIGTNAFYYNRSSLNSVRIPDSVTTIGDSAFIYCNAMTNITIGNSVASIGDDAFHSCSGLRSIAIPNSVTSIGDSAFIWCNGLTNITIGNSVTNIGGSAFCYCNNFASVSIPSSVIYIGSWAFSYCSNLTAFFVDAMNPSFSSMDGVLFNKGQTALVQFPGGVSGSYIMPSSVTSIGDRAFSDCSRLTSVTIPNSVNSVGSYSFYGCSALTNVTIPDSVTSIGSQAFYSCSRLTDATIGASVTNIGSYAFSYCSSQKAFYVDGTNPNYSSLDGVLFNKSQTELIVFPSGKSGSYTIADSVTNLGPNAFFNCTGITDIIIGNSIVNLGNRVFIGCSGLKSATIGNSVTTIGDFAFVTCTRLTSVTIPSSITSIGNSAFSNCGLTNVIIPNSVTNIGTNVFSYCYNLKSVSIPNNVASIGDSSFYYCSYLNNVTIPSSVTNIGNNAFYNCSKLGAMFFAGNAPATGVNAIGPPTFCYYLPGTSGWGATFAGAPAYLWNPAPQAADAKFGIRTNRFGFNIAGTAKIPIVVEASTNLMAATWAPLKTCTLTNGLIYFSDPAWTNFPTRLYRIRSP